MKGLSGAQVYFPPMHPAGCLGTGWESSSLLLLDMGAPASRLYPMGLGNPSSCFDCFCSGVLQAPHPGEGAHVPSGLCGVCAFSSAIHT